MQIGSIEFGDGHVTIHYVDPAQDIRNAGLVMATHTLTVLRSPGYEDEITALEEAAGELLADALEDFRNTEPAVEPEADLVDDEGDD